MKNTLSFILLFLPFISFSQNFSMGVMGGINASYQKFESDSIQFFDMSNNAKPGPIVGASIVCQLNNQLSVKSGFNWQRKGGSKSITFTDENGNPFGEGTLKTNVDYFQIPLLVELSFLKDQIFFLNIGYAFNFLHRAEYKSDAPVFSSTNNDTTDDYEKIDYSFLAGLGVNVPMNKKMIFTFEGRWDAGLSSAWKPGIVMVKNRSVFAAAGFMYQL